jgi:hypothetical protein
LAVVVVRLYDSGAAAELFFERVETLKKQGLSY